MVVSTVFVKVSVMGPAPEQVPVQLRAALAASALPVPPTSEGAPVLFQVKAVPVAAVVKTQLPETPEVNSS